MTSTVGHLLQRYSSLLHCLQPLVQSTFLSKNSSRVLQGDVSDDLSILNIASVQQKFFQKNIEAVSTSKALRRSWQYCFVENEWQKCQMKE